MPSSLVSKKRPRDSDLSRWPKALVKETPPPARRITGDLGDARRAIKFHEQALVIDRETGNRRGESQDLASAGHSSG